MPSACGNPTWRSRSRRAAGPRRTPPPTRTGRTRSATPSRPSPCRGGYPNFLLPDQEEQVANAYGAQPERLVRAKEFYDPERVFTATPLPDRDMLKTHARKN